MTLACLGRWSSFSQIIECASPALNLNNLKDYQYPKFHRYIVRKMENWYRMFPFPSMDNAAEDDSVSGEEGDIVDVPAVDARTVSRS